MQCKRNCNVLFIYTIYWRCKIIVCRIFRRNSYSHDMLHVRSNDSILELLPRIVNIWFTLCEWMRLCVLLFCPSS